MSREASAASSVRRLSLHVRAVGGQRCKQFEAPPSSASMSVDSGIIALSNL